MNATTGVGWWRDQPVAWRRAGRSDLGRRVLLIHGFGANLGHWRFTVPALEPLADVMALDLLGFGASGKPPSWLPGESPQPGSVHYCFDLWAQQVVDLLDAQPMPRDQPAAELHLVGNSIGAMVALTAARLLQQRGTPATQVVLIDCAQRTLDDKRAEQLSILQRLNRPLLKRLVRQRWLVNLLFQTLAQPGFVRQVLKRAYPSGAHVDDELVELLLAPTRDAGARESFRGFINLFNDHLAPELLADLESPVRLLWGAQDPWEDPAEAQDWATHFACIRELVVLPGLGHCPHDEGPELVNPVLSRWIANPAQ
ncbi:MAG: alpha/beta fold hydrolase [Cyanobacteriota bacterium]|nr:alpha/beta fold hydrolase [Cyanobacteriota bacterium]